MKPLVIIPARGGSKGVPRKNIKELGGKPLIYYTIEAAREVFEDKHIIVSTDDEEIKAVVEKTGLKVPFTRPAILATDEAGTHEVLMHAIKFSEENGYHPDVLILLQPTSPFRTETHIKEALALYHDGLDMVVSVKETKSNPYYVLFEEDKNGYLRKSKEGDFTRRQDVPKVWEYNGSIYIISINSLKKNPLHSFKKIRKFVMNDFSSHDIDNQIDWLSAESIIFGNVLKS
ncbi:acylneuraminate cytidylyltransferase family protein [Marivirga salinae]|uniref:Acylneuraminate cytidylyltransferase family protein n=1 Tax=Marivirga salinarum TaxID=3059078 RepID=A0AA49JB79_9BACT|nr:acylneuraminate cytidylyltransferase family protein [Marivirga sp. BDSF4-3]WKK74526.2 acylneuraminate cytidylyltransferase family protein [Marivirga sp. BDSF4-3]